MEACSHNRIIDDIGTTVIPQKMKERFGELEFHHVFGREHEVCVECANCFFVLRRRT